MNQIHLSANQFVIEASVAESIAESLNLPSVLHLLPHLVHSAQALARPPISNFNVGAVGLGSDSRVFVGVNLEFPGLPLHHSVHAEQFLLTNLAVHRCRRLLSFAVSSAPCGHFREFLQELRHCSSVQILVINEENCAQNIDHVENRKPLSKFLPNPFGPHDLLDHECWLLLNQHDNWLDLLPPNAVNSVISVEKEGAKVRHEDTARLVLKAVSPKCDFRTITSYSSSLHRVLDSTTPYILCLLRLFGYGDVFFASIMQLFCLGLVFKQF
ncbi:hypothetical protein MIMGU_mgv1a024584mg [Erythranthe guttata]|uniref:cytidine deaminase n=1 Tax=Erythranthe guttata TaxID=4155 RepID=A0A022Q1Y4_ERYGU|nr:hypothetical protein MIMGU_mgv1a024584mg [Erythranthe guttata]